MKNKDRPLLLNDITVKRRIITTLLTGMNYHNYDETMMRNGCLTLCQLRIPQDVVNIYLFKAQYEFHFLKPKSNLNTL